MCVAVTSPIRSTRHSASLVTNATVLWTTTYLGDALDALRADGYHVTDEAAAHLTPARHDHINFYGTYSFDVETELHREGRRPSAQLCTRRAELQVPQPIWNY